MLGGYMRLWTQDEIDIWNRIGDHAMRSQAGNRGSFDECDSQCMTCARWDVCKYKGDQP